MFALDFSETQSFSIPVTSSHLEERGLMFSDPPLHSTWAKSLYRHLSANKVANGS